MNVEGMIDRITAMYEKKIEEYEEKLNEDFFDVANEVNDLFFKEVEKIYKSFIEQYYSKYETKSYIRHWESKPGTKKGTNLFYGNNSKIHRGKNPRFEIIIDGSRMADDYEYDSADKVLFNVYYGIRGVPPYWYEEWSGTYKSRYFSYSGSMMEAFYEFSHNYVKIMEPNFMRRWKKRRRN